MRLAAWAFNSGGDPLVPPSVEAELKELTPRLGLRFDRSLNCFLITYTWAEDDPRREMIKRGEIEPWSDWEILAPVPADISVEDIRGWCATQLRRVGRNRADIQRLVDEEEARIAKADADAEAARSASAVEELLTASTKNINVGTRRTKVRSIT